MKIALAQINPTVGDLARNSAAIIARTHEARAQGVELVAFPELCVTGYPPLDLLENRFFIDSVESTVAAIASSVPADIGVIIGAPVRNPARTGKRLFNAALLLEGGTVQAEVHKRLLPTYDVFDEYRYFEPGMDQKPVSWRGIRLGIHICEDMWNSDARAENLLYAQNPIHDLAALGVDLFLNISASPFSAGKPYLRTELIQNICRENGVPFLLVNQVGANTEIIFDGNSRAYDASGTQVLGAAAFKEDLVFWDTNGAVPYVPDERPPIKDLHDALVLGIRDYVRKTGFFKKVLIGLSGGIDSAVTCALAVEAVGPDRVMGVTMPSGYSSAGSVSDSEMLARALAIEFRNVSIVPAVRAFGYMLEPLFSGTEPGVAEENVQARSRGLTLMSISNKFDHLLLTTGNKSEMAVGYATLYGDMNGGLAVLADVFKGQVYELAEYINRNAGRDIIPQSTIDKVPSAELRPGQTDQDTLPPYPILDRILRLYVEDLLEIDAIVAETGYDSELVLDILRKVDRNEYKRRQAPPGLRVSGKAFGMGRRLPIVMRWDR